MGSEWQRSGKFKVVCTDIRDKWECNGDSLGKFKWYFSPVVINGSSMAY